MQWVDSDIMYRMRSNVGKQKGAEDLGKLHFDTVVVVTRDTHRSRGPQTCVSEVVAM